MLAYFFHLGREDAWDAYLEEVEAVRGMTYEGFQDFSARALARPWTWFTLIADREGEDDGEEDSHGDDG